MNPVAISGLGALPDCHVQMPGGGGAVPCQPGMDLPECDGCFDAPVKQGFFAEHQIWPAVVSGVIIAVATGVVVHQLGKRGIRAV